MRHPHFPATRHSIEQPLATTPAFSGTPAPPTAPAGADGEHEARWSPTRPATSGSTYDAAFAAVFERLGPVEQVMRTERAQAARLALELTEHPAGRAQLLIRNSRRFTSAALAQLLIDKAIAWEADDPRQSEGYAELAREIALRLDPGRYGTALPADLTARAWLATAAARHRGDTGDAAAALAAARDWLERGSGDPLELGRALALEATLLSARGHLHDALLSNARAICVRRRAGDAEGQATGLIFHAELCRLLGRPAAGLVLLSRALECVENARTAIDAGL